MPRAAGHVGSLAFTLNSVGVYLIDFKQELI